MSEFKQVGGVWLPATEEHMSAWMVKKNEVVEGKLTYQYHKLVAAMKWVKNFGVAVDVGAHCGLWSMHLAKRFGLLHSFEPISLHQKCFLKNVPQDDPEHVVVLHPVALGEKNGTVLMNTTRGSSGDSWIDGNTDWGGVGGVPLRRLDDEISGTIDFIKLDCEGYELFALRGGEEILKASRPCVVVEQKPGRAQKYGLPETGAVSYLQSLGAVLRKEIGGDFILSWD